MDWIAVVDFGVSLAQIALCGWLGCGAVLAVIALLPTGRNNGKRRAPHERLRPLVEFEHTK